MCEYWGVPTSEIDVMMGTFTKSFGAMGGYIAGSEELISYLRQNTDGTVYSSAMSPTVCRQVLQAFTVLTGEDGTNTGVCAPVRVMRPCFCGSFCPLPPRLQAS